MLPSLASVAAVAERYRLPVIVDAAAQLPPKDNLRRFIGEGAALVAFSGGKAIRGPQGTGILCGREKLIAAALIQMLDMDVLPETWAPPDGLLARHFGDRFPHHGLGRGFKVDKESIVGLLVALERFVAADVEADIAARHEMLRRLAAAIAGMPGCTPREPEAAAGAYPSLDIEIDASQLGRDAYAVSRALQRHDPPVHLSERFASQGLLTVASAGLRTEDAEIVAQALRQVLGRNSSKA
jgi:D-glucosaminate-6-phosphate ammonia-lyase